MYMCVWIKRILCKFCALKAEDIVRPLSEIWTGFNFLHPDSPFQPATLNKGGLCAEALLETYVGNTTYVRIKSSPQTKTFSKNPVCNTKEGKTFRIIIDYGNNQSGRNVI